jgi:hypothetical protein
MLTFAYYLCWATIVAVYALFLITTYKMHQKKIKILPYIAPLVLNLFLSAFGTFVLLMSTLSTLMGHMGPEYYLFVIGCIAGFIVPNILLYRLYYKRKNKLSKKHYFLASLYGLSLFMLYVASRFV